jgi:hypothetical protein
MNIYVGRLFLVTSDEEFMEIFGYNEGDKLKKDRGYLKGEYVYVYRGRLEGNKNDIPMGIYLNSIGEHEFIGPNTLQEKLTYSVNNLVEFDIDNIFDEIDSKRGDFLSETDIEVINANTEILTTVIKPDDDLLKRAIKEAINRKGINLKLYRERFKNEHSLNNMKSALNKRSNMSVKYFLDWCEILGLDWTLYVHDSGSDKISSLDEDIVIKNK